MKNALYEINHKPFEKQKQEKVDEQDEDKQAEETKAQDTKKKIEPFSVACSREKLSKLEKDPNQPPPLGTYNPR